MVRLTCDASDVIAVHQAVTQRIVAGIEETCPQAGEAAVEEIRADLRGKILRPREGTDRLASHIGCEIVNQPAGILIGIGNIEIPSINPLNYYQIPNM